MDVSHILLGYFFPSTVVISVVLKKFRGENMEAMDRRLPENWHAIMHFAAPPYDLS
jgi:hypothetical protein